MFLVRRVFKVKKGTARKAAAALTEIGKMYEEAGQRSPSRVYFSGSTTPGPADTVYMDWVEEVLQSPYRADNPTPSRSDQLYVEFLQYQEDSWIEFYELYSGA